MQWLKVIFAGFIEIIWVTGINTANSWWSWLFVLFVIALSFYLMISACKHLPVGTVYAVFVGIGAVGTVIVDIVFFGESFNIIKISLIILLVIGIMGLKLATEEGDE
ncbi:MULTISPECIES: DMT family transporter [Staphylococcus]|uniref:SMR family transporter n=1 Tax=Staphylococcus hsinchuensis TaxID=3051183 RepID=A0ABZ3ED77_9STAP|nr:MULTISPECIES: SMR family transporter [unclassified Staphylococcus]